MSVEFELPEGLKQVFLVGGAVRDKLLGIESHDRDFVVVGESEQKMTSLGFLPVGNDFPVYLHPITKDEYALARTERKTSQGYTGFVADAADSVSLEEDLARRDLSINSMAMDVEGNIIDPFGGQADLKSKVLRHTTNAFIEDPVRVLRIARFYARLGPKWRIAQTTRSLMKKMYQDGELNYLVAERVWKETERALMEPYPPLFFETLVDLGLFPELGQMRDIPQPRQHHPEGDVFVHTMLVIQRAADLRFDLATRFAALTHDFGKPVVFSRAGNLHGHEAMGVSVVEDFCQGLKVPKKLLELAKLTSDNHTRCHKIKDMSAKKLYQFIVVNMNALKHEKRFLQFLNACLCDAQGRGPTLVNRAYPQVEIAQAYLRALKSLDAKAVVKNAIEKGAAKEQISEALRIAQIDVIRQQRLIFTKTNFALM